MKKCGHNKLLCSYFFAIIADIESVIFMEQLTREALNQVRRELEQKYIDLRKGLYNEDEEQIRVALDAIKMQPLKDQHLVIKGLFFLVMRGYLKEVADYIDSMTFTKINNRKIELLRRIIADYECVDNLNEDERNVYEAAIRKGRIAYKKHNYRMALNRYEWGFEVTKAPIFLYYMGKMYYKMGSIKQARAYLLRYVRVGGFKLNRAYLYLAKIFERSHQSRNARACAKNVELYSELLEQEMAMYVVKDDEGEDEVKAVVQHNNRIGEELFNSVYNDRVSEFRELYKSGDIKLAEEKIAELEAKEDKTRDDCIVLGIVRRNKVLYKNCRKV